jgi:hypothetical protein
MPARFQAIFSEVFSMKRLLSIVLLALALPLSAFAVKSVRFGNSGGTLAGTSAGLNVTDSELVIVNGLKLLNGGNGGDQVTGDLGTVSLSTGRLVSGSSDMGGVFAGGSFTITGNGQRGIPEGTIFTGTFRGPVKWTMVTLANGTHAYLLSGSLTGTWYTGATGSGATVQLTINTGTDFFEGSVDLSNGDASITVAPSE